MKKFLISAIVIVVIILIGVLVFGENNDYVANIEDDVTELEAELADVEELIASDELTEEEATRAYERISERIASIEASIEASQDDPTISDEEKQKLVAALERFREAVINYSSSINVLEETADIEATATSSTSDRSPMYPGTSIVNRLEAAVEALVDHIDEVVEGDILAELVDDETYEEITGEEPDTATSSDDGMADEEEEPMMEDGTLTDDDMSTSSDEETATSTQ